MDSTATQTTLWPAQPTATSQATSTANTTAIATATSLSLVTKSTFTLFGTSTFTTSSTATARSVFTNSAGIPSTTPLPIVTISQTVTSYSTTSSTITALFTNSVNTSTTTTSSAAAADTLTVLVTGTTFSSTRGTFLSTITVTTLTSGYTTASMATGSGGTALTSTTLLTAPQIAATTTTIAITWFYDTSCPTALSTGGSTTTSGSTTLSAGSSYSTGFAGYFENFTQNLFAAPFVQFGHGSSLMMLSAGTSTIYAPAAVQVWAPIPSMQGFSPWTATTATFQSISAPAGVTALALLPFATRSILSTNSTGAAVTSTAAGVWGIWANPLTTTFTTTGNTTIFTTSSTSTITTTATSTLIETSVSRLTFTSSASNASSTNSFTVSLGSNGEHSAATISQVETFTTTTGTGGSTTASSSSSGSGGFTLAGSITSTFCESYGYAGTSQVTGTVSTISNATFSTGTTTSTSNYLTTATVNSTVTFLTSWFPANSVSNPTAIAVPGIGGHPKITGGAATIYANGAAVSLFAGSTFTWSTADPNFVQIVVGSSFTTTSSTTSAAGAGTFTAYTIPGEVSILTSPALSISTAQNRYVPPATFGTSFWPVPAPALTPDSVLNR